MEPIRISLTSLVFPGLYNLPIRSGRSKVEIDQDLSLMTKKIKKQWNKRTGLLYTTLPVSKQLTCNIIRKPLNTIFKLTLFAVSGYIIYLLIRGTFAGIEVDFDTDFRNVFSRDKQTRLSAGLNLTNGDQAGQFLRDGLITAFVVFKIILEKPYYKVAGKVINDCYKSHLVDLLASFHEQMQKRDEINENDKELNYNLITSLENLNRLYEHLEEDLKPYGAQPLSYREIIFASSQNEINPDSV